MREYLTSISQHLRKIENPPKAVDQAIVEINKLNFAMMGSPSKDDLTGPAQRLATLVPVIKNVDEEAADLVESISRNILAGLE